MKKHPSAEKLVKLCFFLGLIVYVAMVAGAAFLSYIVVSCTALFSEPWRCGASVEKYDEYMWAIAPAIILGVLFPLIMIFFVLPSCKADFKTSINDAIACTLRCCFNSHKKAGEQALGALHIGEGASERDIEIREHALEATSAKLGEVRRQTLSLLPSLPIASSPSPPPLAHTHGSLFARLH